MTYSVLTQIANDWVALKFATNLISTAHMSSADTLAHARFKDGSNVRVVSAADHSRVFYELTAETHFVDDTGKVCVIQPVPEGDRRYAGTIDMTPTWSAVLPYLILAFTNGTDEAQRLATEELKNMAKAADAWNSSVK